MKLDKNYNFKDSEKKWQQFWQKEKVFKFDEESKKIPFAIDTPPPTVSGKMHIGHAYSYIQMDIMARFWRLLGFNLFYPFGTDDNGLPTERLVEKTEKVRAKDMGRADFIKLCQRKVSEWRPEYIQSWKSIGLSCDFDLFYSTIDDHSRKISQWSFLDLYKKGRIYKKRAPFMWCPECQTAISQIELKDKEQNSRLVYIEFDTDLSKKITIATTRPELLPACVAIHVNPADERYKEFLGHEAVLPFFERRVKIYANPEVDMEYGTGAVYHCTFGDMDDVEWISEFKISPIEVIGKDGRLNDKAAQFAGLSVREARKEIVKALDAAGRIKKIEEIRHVVNTHERCDTDIEILMTDQWFIKILDMKDKLLAAGEKIVWHPAFMRNRYDNWVKGLKYDWNISRQRYFGVPIPVWYCQFCGEVVLAREEDLPVDPSVDKPPVSACPKCGKNSFVAEKDVLDTWPTSSMTPQIALGLLKNEKLKQKLYPMNLRPQAHDIITFWLFNTTVKALSHFNKIPWKEAMISGWVLDPKGIKMSKSKGNIVEPQDVLAEYGADAVRFWAAGNSLGRDIRFSEKELNNGKRLTTKLYNATKFIAPHLEGYKFEKNGNLRAIDKWVLCRLNKTIQSATSLFENYEYAKALESIYNFFWHDLADNYIEFVKYRLYNKAEVGEKSYSSAQHTLYLCLKNVLKLLAPILPHISEEIWQAIFAGEEKSIHISSWPEVDKKLIDEKIEKKGQQVVEFLAKIREYKTKNGLAMNAKIDSFDLKISGKELKSLELFLEDLRQVGSVKEFKN